MVGSSGQSAGASLPANSISYGYDSLGRLTTVIDPSQTNGVGTYSYDAVGNLTQIARLSSASLSVVQLAPTSGAVGSTVLIYGTGFSATPANDTVKFNGTTAAVSSATQTMLTASVPAGATSGTVSVTVSGSTATSSQSFTVTGPGAAPTISSLSAAIAVPGQNITVAGTNFATTQTDDVATFNIGRARVTAATGTSLTAQVPPGGATGHVGVITPDGSVTSAADVFVPPSPYTVANVGFTARAALGAQTTVILPTPGQIGMVAFDETDGGRVFVNIPSSTFSIADVYLYDAYGQVVAKTTVGPGGGYIDTASLQRTATYTVVVVPGAGVTGSMPISVLDVPGDVTSPITAGTPSGPSVVLPIGNRGQNGSVTFSGTAGDRVFLNMTSNTIGGISTASLIDPNGAVIKSVNLLGSSSTMDTTTLGSTGTYTYLIDPSGANTGSVTLALSSVPADLSSPIAAGTPTGPSVNFNITTPGQNASATFTGTTGQRIFLNMTGLTIGGFTAVTIKDPSGATVASASIFGSSGIIDTTTLNPQGGSGTYTILVDPGDANTGSVTLTLSDVPADPSQPITIGGSSVTLATTTPGQNATAPFTGAANQKVTLNVTGLTIGGFTTVKIVDPSNNNAVIASTSMFGSSGTLNATLTAAGGSFTIVIDPEQANTGSATLSLIQGTFAPIRQTSDPTPSQTSSGTRVRKPQPFPSYRSSSTDAWQPDRGRLYDWASGSAPSPFTAAAKLRAPRGVTAISGQALRLDGSPLAHATLSIGHHTATTDRYGRFLLARVPSGHQVLVIDGSTANRPGASYGLFEDGVQVVKGRTTALPYTIWMPKLDTVHEMHFSYPLRHTLVVKTPLIPGLKVIIPAGSTIKDRNGDLVTHLGITAIPTDRPPFPLPAGVKVPTYFTVQPGASYVAPSGARIIYPNYQHDPPKARIDFWNYDPDVRGWYVYGKGTVTNDGTQVIPDPGVQVYEFTGAMINCFSCLLDPSSLWPLLDPFGKQPGDPVDPGTGLFEFHKTDLYEPDVMPLSLSRTYRQGDVNDSGALQVRTFGVGQSWTYDMFLYSPGNSFLQANLILADGSRVHFVRTSPGTGFQDAVFQAQDTPSDFYHASMVWNGKGWDLRMKTGLTYVFGENAPLQAIRDRNGNQITIVRSNGQTGQVTQVISPNGRWIQFSYASPNCTTCVSQATDQSGRTVNYTYNTNKQLTNVQDVLGGNTVYNWNQTAGKLDQMLSITDPRNVTFLTNTYQAAAAPLDRIQTQTLALPNTGGTTHPQYSFSYTVDGNNNVTQTDVTNPIGTIGRYGFTNGLLTSYTDGLGTTVSQAETYTRDGTTGRLTSTTDARNRRTDLTYDGNGNIASITRLAGTAGAVTTAFSWDPKYSQLTQVTDPLQHSESYTLDGHGNVTGITNALNKTWTITWNNHGQQKSVTDPLQNQSSIGYTLGDPTSYTDERGKTSTRFVDSAGRTTRFTDPLGATSRLTYDAANELKTQLDPNNGTTSYTYDGDGNLLTFKDARNQTTTYTYDDANNLKTHKDSAPAGSNTETYTYDPDSNPASLVDRRGTKTLYTYDALDRPKVYTYGKTTNGFDSTVTLTWDNGNRLTNVADSATASPSGTIARTYDELDRLTAETVTPQGGSARGTTGYTYDSAGRRLTMAVTGEPTLTYSYDNADKLTQITPATGNPVILTYDDSGAKATTTLPDGIKQAFAYDQAHNVASITYTNAANATIGDLQYAYDANGLRVGMGGSYARTGLPQTFTGTYNSGNRLTSYTQNGGSAVNLTYDANGNLTNDGTNTLTWDSRNQLTKIAAGHTTVATYAYDGLGRRAKAVIGTTTTQYLYDLADPVAEQGATGTLSASLLTGPGVDEIYARTPSGGAQSNFLSDALGSTIGLADPSGVVQTSYTYDPFGVTTSSGQTNGSNYRYTGREADAAGLIYYRARYYKPSLGRFVSEDPIGFGSGPNLYAYATDSPTNLSDPYGTCVGPLIELLPWCVEAGITTGEAVWAGITAAEATYLGTWLGTKWSQDPYSFENGTSFKSSDGSAADSGRFWKGISKKIQDRLRDNPNMTVQEYVSKYLKGSVWKKLPSDVAHETVRDALRSGNTTVRKILTGKDYEK